MNQKIFILSMSDGVCCGAYSNLDELSKAVDDWKSRFPHHILMYQCWRLNKSKEAIDWDWCYIPTTYDEQTLLLEHDFVPQQSYFGTNLVGVNWEPINVQ